MQYTDNEAALIGGLISNYFLRPAVSAALKNSYIHVLEHLHTGRVSAPQRDLKIGGKLVLNLIFFTASVISILHDSPSVSVCFLANRTVYGGISAPIGPKKA